MPLLKLDIPTPRQLRGGWAARAAIYASYGWKNTMYATENQWYYHDGGGNWACIRFAGPNRAILFGHDHEKSDTYFRDAAQYFGEPETNLVKDAPAWWETTASDPPGGDWIGFIYGWDGANWYRAEYENHDGFADVGLLDAIGPQSIAETLDFFELSVDTEDIDKLIALDANITAKHLAAVMPDFDIAAGVEAAHKFLLADLG